MSTPPASSKQTAPATRPPRRPRRDLSITQLLPNMLTIAAICAGLTAIRMGTQGAYLLAVQLVLVAAVLDGVDGRIARLMGADSEMGAELDSLADFLNFGVAPPLVLYYWALEDARAWGWIAVLTFAVCCVLRLARFNVAAKSETKPADHFVGVPAPAGALLAMLPLYLAFAFPEAGPLPDAVICLWLWGVGILMITHIPTPSFKRARVSRENAKFLLVAFTVTISALLTFAWIVLVVLCAVYIATVIWALLRGRRAAAPPGG